MTNLLLLVLLTFSNTPDDAPEKEEAPAPPSIKVTLTREKPCPKPEEEAGFECIASQVVYDGTPKDVEYVDLNPYVGKLAGEAPYSSAVHMKVESGDGTVLNAVLKGRFVLSWESGAYSVEGKMMQEAPERVFETAALASLELPGLLESTLEIEEPEIRWTDPYELLAFVGVIQKADGARGLCSAALAMDPEGKWLTKEASDWLYSARPDIPDDDEHEEQMLSFCGKPLLEKLEKEPANPLYDLRDILYVIQRHGAPDTPPTDLLRLHYQVFNEC